jgi:uncharacterized protein (TIGR02266 family)
MSQDTRKDKRAKVVSLNVRYKSATVDEFIENHSHDVSKGGLFVKTPTPFPPGTLLKFEIRLAGDKSVISGVGRVVWKREPTQSGADKPAGMGVKFIKIDDSSRAIIDRLIAQKADAGSAYTSEDPVEDAPAGHPSTLKGLVAAAPVAPDAAPGPSPVTAPAAPAGGAKIPVPSPAAAAPAPKPAPAAGPPAPVAKSPVGTGTLPGPRAGAPAVPGSQPKVPGAAPAPASEPKLPGARPAVPANKLASTVMGVAPPPAVAKAAPAPAAPVAAAPPAPASEPKLPAAAPRPPPPARKATMMGMAPATGTPAPPPAAAAPEPPAAAAKAAEPMFPRLDPESGSEPVRDQTVMKQAAELLEEALKEAGGSLEEIGQNPLFGSDRGSSIHEQAPATAQSQSGDTMIMASPAAGDQPSPISSPPPAAGLGGLSPSAPAVSEARSSSTNEASKKPPVGETLRAEAAKKKGGSAGLLVAALLVLVLAGGGVYAYSTGMLAGIVGPTPPVPSATPSAAASTTGPATPPSASASAAAVMAGDAGPAATDASAASTATDASAAAAMDAATSEIDSGKDAGKVGTTTTAAPPPPAPAPPPPRPAPPPRPKPPAPPPTGETPAGETPAPAPAPVPTPAPAPTPKTDPANEL